MKKKFLRGSKIRNLVNGGVWILNGMARYKHTLRYLLFATMWAWLSLSVLKAATPVWGGMYTKTRNAKTKPSRRNDRNHRNDQTKIAKPTKHNNKTTETSDITSDKHLKNEMYVIHRSFVSVVLVVTFVWAVSFRSFRSFRFDCFVLAFWVLVHAVWGRPHHIPGKTAHDQKLS